jgi:hypothetical protein
LGLNDCVASRELIGLRSNSRGFNIRSAPASSAGAPPVVQCKKACLCSAVNF